MKKHLLALFLLLPLGSLLFASSIQRDTIFAKNGEPIILQFIKHASLSITYKGKCIQIDPVTKFADYTIFPKSDLILITHEHFDHLDSVAVAQLTKSNTKLVSNPASQKILNKGLAMKNGELLQPLPWLKIEAVPAYNTTPGREKYHPKGRDNGYILTIGGTRIYVAGDTEDIPEMSTLKQIDVAFLPVNQPYTMTVEQAVRAAKIIQARILYPYHFGETKVVEIKDLLKKDTPNMDVRLRAME